MRIAVHCAGVQSARYHELGSPIEIDRLLNFLVDQTQITRSLHVASRVVTIHSETLAQRKARVLGYYQCTLLAIL